MKIYYCFFYNFLCKFAVVCCLCFYAKVSYAWQGNINGQITDKDNKPVAATITVKGTKNSFYSGADGNFTLPPGFGSATLIVSGINIETTEKKLDNQQVNFTIVVQLKTVALDEVLVGNTGYQQIKPNELNGSVVVVNNKLLNQQTGTNILKRLDGVTSGLLFNTGKSNVNPQNTTNISIRGLSTINGPLDPLVVLDGFIYEGKIDNINPNDVENITVLKDASAASIWGARAGNGVIVITTKKGKFSQKMQVTGSATFLVSERPDLFSIKQVSNSDYIGFETDLFNRGYFDYRIDDPYLSLTPLTEILLQRRNGDITPADSAKFVGNLTAFDTRRDYEKYLYTNAHTKQYAVNLQGGSGNNVYSLGVGYEKTVGTLHDENKKLNIRFDNSYRPVKDLTISVGVYYTNGDSHSGAPQYGSILPGERSVPYYRLVNEDGSVNAVSTYLKTAFTDTAGGGKLLPWQYYPLTDYKSNTQVISNKELYSTIGIQYKLFSFLNIEVHHQYQEQQTMQSNVATMGSYFARNLINTFTQIDPATGVVTYEVPLGSIRNIDRAITRSQTFRTQLNFNKSFGVHGVTALGGFEVREAKQTGDNYTAFGYNADPLTSVAVDPVNPYPTIFGYEDYIPAGVFFTNTTYRFVSVYGNAAYNFKEKYSLMGSIRNDGSNIFGASINDRWRPLWSASAGWKLSEESWYRSKILPFLKARLSYGASGNVDLRKTALAVAQYATCSSVPFPFGRINSLNNPDLKWEKATQWNAAVDFATKNERVAGSLEVYRKIGKDLYGQTPYDYTAWGGTYEIVKNVANMRGTGFDINLNANVLKKNIKWSVNLLYSKNKSITTKYFSSDANDATRQLGGGSSIIPIVGMPMYGIVAYRWAGLDSSGNPQGYVNGQKSTNYTAILS